MNYVSIWSYTHIYCGSDAKRHRTKHAKYFTSDVKTENCEKIDQLDVSLIYLRPDQFHLICLSNHNPLELIKCDFAWH